MSRTIATLILLTLVTLGSCKAKQTTSEPDAIIGKDDRTETFIKDSKWSPVGYLDSVTPDGSKYGCTATLVGPKTLLTASHCILKDAEMTFRVNYDYKSDKSQATGKVSKVIARGIDIDVRFYHSENIWRKNKDKDWALLQLEAPYFSRNLGNRFGYFKVDILRQGDSIEKIRTVGYPADLYKVKRPIRVSNVNLCKIVGEVPKGQVVFRHNCDTYLNHSGAPFLITDSTGNFTRIVGIHSGGWRKHLPENAPLEKLNFGVTTVDVLKHL